MAGTNRRAGKFSPNDGYVLPAEGFTGRALVDCPEVGDQARAFWADWATSQFAWHFAVTEWRDLHDSTILMDRFYQGDSRVLAEVRQHTGNLFGLGTRSKLHVTEEVVTADPDAAPAAQRRLEDPRLKVVPDAS